MLIKNLGKKFIINLFLVLLIFLIDRISKIYVIYLDKKFLGSEILSSKFLNINLIWNEGIAFGLFSFTEKIYYNLLTILICLIIAVLIWFMFRSEGFEKLSYIMIIGGSFGNVFDRIFYSAVPDFIDIHFNNFHWFIFNVADIFVTLGIFCLIGIEIFSKKINENYK